MLKNTTGQKITLLAIDTANNVPKTGDAANLTAYISKDDGAVTVLGDTTATELDATNAPGLYSFDLTQGETNADKLIFSGKSSTANIKLIPVLLYTHPTGGIASPTNITAGTITTVTTLTNTPAFNGPSAATIADTVWDEALVGHQTIGTMGYYIGETHSTGDLLYTDWENGGRLDVILDARASQASVDDLPTNAELATALGTADDATLAAIGALNNLSAANVRTAIGLASANLDTQLADLPTVAELEARTLLAAAYGTAVNQVTIAGYLDTEVAAILAAVDTEVGAIKTKTDQLTFTVANQVDANTLTIVGTHDDAILAAIAALNNLSAAQVNTEADTALSDAGVTLARMGALTDWIDGGRLDLILDTIAANVAAVLLDTGTDGVVMSAALCNKIADHVRRRTQANVEASSDGDTLSLLSLYGLIQQVQQSAANGATLTVKKTDTTTTLGTRTLASDAGADPVTGVS